MGPEDLESSTGAGAGLRQVVDGLPVVVWEAEVRSGACTFVSAGCRALLGRSPAFWLTDPAAALSVHPEDREHYTRARDEAWAREGEYEISFRALAADGRVVWLQELARVGPGGRVRGVLLDASERRKEAERQQFLAGFERGLQELDDAEQVMVYAARSLGEYLGADRCAYAEAEEDQDHFLMSGDHATGLPPLPGRFAMSAFGNGCVRAMRAGRSWVVADSRHDDRLEPADLDAYQVTGIRAVICVPLQRGGRFVAAMAVHQATVRHWTAAEVDLVELIVARCWESIQRTHAGRALRDSEQRHRLLVERATDAIWVLDRDLRFAEINAAACDLLGYARDELAGTPITGLLDAAGGRRWRQLIAEPGTLRETSEVHHVRRADGTQVALELSIQATPSGVQAIGRDVTERRRREAERDLLLQQEHEIAETLQRSLLPRELPSLPRVAAAARYQPAAAHAQTGGDWYELVALGGSLVALSVGDVVGKGPQAAAVMGQLRSALAGSLLDGHGPAAALDRLDAFAARTDGAAGTTCACLTLDWETGELRWATAGHPPPVVVEDGAARLLSGGGRVLGGPGGARRPEQTATLAVGASVLLYTDGLVERRAERIDEGLRRLCEAAAGAHAKAPESLVAEITGTLLDGEQQDDVALLAIRLVPPPLHRKVAAELGALRRLRAELARWSALAGLSAELHQDLSLALGEAVANSVEHAFAGAAGEVTCSVTPTAAGKFDVVVRDDGTWRPEPADNSHRGRGIAIITALAEEFGIDHDERGTTVRFRLAAEPAAAPGAPTPSFPYERCALSQGVGRNAGSVASSGDGEASAGEVPAGDAPAGGGSAGGVPAGGAPAGGASSGGASVAGDLAAEVLAAGGSAGGGSAGVPGVALPSDVTVGAGPSGSLVLGVTGDLDLTTIEQVRPAVLHRIGASTAADPVVDLTGLRYLSSCGVALLLEAAAVAARRGASLTVRVGARSAPVRILELAGLTTAATGALTVEAVPPPDRAGPSGYAPPGG